MKSLKMALLAAVALLFASVPLAANAATVGGWSVNGWTQWHPNDGVTPLGAVGTQCYFCKADAVTAAPPPAPVAAAPAAPVDKRKCTDVPKGAPVDKDGCWVIKNLNFRFNSAKIEGKSKSSLQETATVLKQNPEVKVEIQGHTDNIGTPAYNQKLSQRRANAVMKSLVKKGIKKQRMTAKGYGLEKPIASNATKEGRAENRRVELRVVK
ncbi:MAG: OmpA family protein [Magnetococcus sp. YQC-3]